MTIRKDLPTLSYCCYATLTLYTRSHAVKNTSQIKEETDNMPTDKIAQVTSDMNFVNFKELKSS